jgi:hypothetical protein
MEIIAIIISVVSIIVSALTAYSATVQRRRIAEMSKTVHQAGRDSDR